MQRSTARWSRNIDIEVGARIRTRRLQTGATPHILAFKAGVTTQALETYERGDATVPALALERLAKALGLKVSDLQPATKR